MEISREDLLKQKAALEQQLQWVNRMLAASGGDAPAAPIPSPSAPMPDSTPEAPHDPGADFEAANRRYQSPAAPEPVPAAGTPPYTLPQELQETPSASVGTFSLAQKIGCFAIAAGICLGILFALFVLPYLIY